jgi:hypothetical protein
LAGERAIGRLDLDLDGLRFRHKAPDISLLDRA